MFKPIIITILSLATSMSFGATYEVSIKNLTKGQPLTPPVVSIHHQSTSLVELGTKATQGLEELARDGKTEVLIEELKTKKGVLNSKVGDGLILPGQTQKIIIKTKSQRNKISIVSMLARTNDAIAVLSNASLKLKRNNYRSHFANVYDAGVEINTESCKDIPAPPCGNPGKGENEDGLILPHPGIQNIGELNSLEHVFASKAALIKIKRIK